LRIAVGYLIFTAATFVVAPFATTVQNLLELIAYSLVCWAAFAAGGRYGAWSYVAPGANPSTSNKTGKWLTILSIYTIAITVATLEANGHLTGLQDTITSILTPGESYFRKFETAEALAGSASFVGQINTILAALPLLLMPMAVVNWTSIPTSVKIVAATAILTRTLSGLLTGTMVDIALVILEIAIGFLYLSRTGQLNPKLVGRSRTIITTSALAFLTYGSYTQVARMEHLGLAPWVDGSLIGYHSDNLLVPILGGQAAYGLNSLLYYMNHGYEGLAQCLSLPDLDWMYGLGHSRALMEYAEQYLGWHWIWDQHPLWKNQAITGRDPLMVWSTAIPWLAADLTFWGVPLALYAFGYLYSRTWKVSLVTANPIALALFAKLAVFVLFLPANNQIFQSRGMWWGTMLLTALYVLSRRRTHRDQ